MQEVKQFSPAEANRTLPLVKRIVTDILSTGKALQGLQLDLADDEPNDEVQALVDRLNELSGELDQVGCTFKDWDFSIGLVDFPSIIDEEEVLLCWRSDEPELRYYHGVADGYAGRKLIPRELLYE